MREQIHHETVTPAEWLFCSDGLLPCFRDNETGIRNGPAFFQQARRAPLHGSPATGGAIPLHNNLGPPRPAAHSGAPRTATTRQPAHQTAGSPTGPPPGNRWRIPRFTTAPQPPPPPSYRITPRNRRPPLSTAAQPRSRQSPATGGAIPRSTRQAANGDAIPLTATPGDRRRSPAPQPPRNRWRSPTLQPPALACPFPLWKETRTTPPGARRIAAKDGLAATPKIYFFSSPNTP